jgi:hypothetical protein
MFERLKKIFKNETPGPLVIRFEEIPLWLDKRKDAITGNLQKDTAAPMRTIREAAQNLEQIIQMLHAAEFNAEIHPKLKSIAKNTLPQYAKAMETALLKPLPEDVDGFYTAATEMLKGCLNSSRGQGKYLQTVFPEEMKTVRQGIDAIGREINAMTGALASFRKEMERIGEAEKTHGALVDITNDTEKSHEKENRIGQRVLEIQTRIEECRQEIQRLETDTAQLGITGQQRTIQVLAEDRDKTIRRYAALSMTASHVLRKAEKLAHKQHKANDEGVLRHALYILSDHTVPDTTVLAGALSSASPVAVRMIETGDVPLKNKEERAIFSDPAGFISEISTLSVKYAEQAKQCDEAEQALRSHPTIIRTDSLVREKNQLEVILEKELRSKIELINWRNDLQKSIPSLQQKLEKTMGDLSGSDVQLHYPLTFTSSP